MLSAKALEGCVAMKRAGLGWGGERKAKTSWEAGRVVTVTGQT